jgi:hypothetical protein
MEHTPTVDARTALGDLDPLIEEARDRARRRRRRYGLAVAVAVLIAIGIYFGSPGSGPSHPSAVATARPGASAVPAARLIQRSNPLQPQTACSALPSGRFAELKVRGWVFAQFLAKIGDQANDKQDLIIRSTGEVMAACAAHPNQSLGEVTERILGS